MFNDGSNLENEEKSAVTHILSALDINRQINNKCWFYPLYDKNEIKVAHKPCVRRSMIIEYTL